MKQHNMEVAKFLKFTAGLREIYTDISQWTQAKQPQSSMFSSVRQIKLKSQCSESVGHSSTCLTCTEVKQTPDILHQQFHMMQAPWEKIWVTSCTGGKRVIEAKEGYKMQILLDTAGIVPATPSQPSVLEICSKT